MSLYGVVKRVGNLVDPVIQRRLFVCMEFDFPVLLNVQLAIFVDEIMCRWQLVNIFEECFCARRILERQIVFKGGGIQHLFKVRMRQETLDFRAEQECFSHLCIIQRFDAEEISCSEQGFLFLVPDDKGEHTTQLLQQCCAVFLIAVNQNFGVGLCCKLVSFFDQRLTNGLVVINFAIEEQGKIAICTVKRLCAGIGYVNDAQATVTKGDVLVNVSAFCIRPSMFDSVQHFLKNRIGIVDMVCKTGKSTHR